MLNRSNNIIQEVRFHLMILIFLSLVQVKRYYSYKIDGCYGMPDGLIFMFLFLVGLIVFSLSLVRIMKSGDNQFIRKAISVSLLFLGPVLNVFQITFDLKKIKGEVKLLGTQPNSKIVLRSDNDYTISFRHAELTCFKSGKCLESNDTILLEEDFIYLASIKYSSKYFIDGNKLIALDSFDSDNLKGSFNIE